jgi:hypothetical protein
MRAFHWDLIREGILNPMEPSFVSCSNGYFATQLVKSGHETKSRMVSLRGRRRKGENI